ncbi:hypothetical protein D8674_011555 [Pyrus ussuriensis x Pyrus communis]|uniref:Uncharacterized protein n=1 Tax=Pyrus ussuriensis x Pyrus communis TaxID=2448454 RepID=A0A5N5FZU9_9ROSA|nr:hypothetical protein D8674_011555 [Pyrus ussuriensis x Pyrus communis]
MKFVTEFNPPTPCSESIGARRPTNLSTTLVPQQLKWTLHFEGVNNHHKAELMHKKAQMRPGFPKLLPGRDVVTKLDADVDLPESDPYPHPAWSP